MNTVGTVEAISTKTINTKFGAKNKYSLKIDGVWYDGGWKKPSVVEGTTVSFDYTDGKYGKEITGELSPAVAGLGAGTSVSSGAVGAGKPRGKFDAAPFPVPPLDPSRSIIRQNALRHATAIVNMHFEQARHAGVATAAVDISKLTESVIHAAKLCENYISGYDDMEAAASEVENTDLATELAAAVKKTKK